MQTSDPGLDRSVRTPCMAYGPAAEPSTYRDLLIFEERLKQSASRLRKRKRRWETLLVASMITIAVLAYIHQFSPPSIDLVDRLLTSFLLFLATSVCLFFVSGLYSDRIVAASRYSQQANRALRNLNMHLNLRTAPQRGIFSRFFLPFASSASGMSRPTPRLTRTNSRSPSSTSLTSTGSGGTSGTRRHALSGIPPSINPRGELIFSSRIPIKFRQGYERYRAAFERRRSERLEARRSAGWRFWLYTGAGWGWWRKEIWKPADASLGARPQTPRSRHAAHSSSTSHPTLGLGNPEKPERSDRSERSHRHSSPSHHQQQKQQQQQHHHHHQRTTSSSSSKSNGSQRRRHAHRTSSPVPPLPALPRPPSPTPSDTSCASSN